MRHPVAHSLDPRTSSRRSLPRVILLAALALLSGCGGSSPTEPGVEVQESAGPVILMIQGQPVRVDDDGCGTLDLERIGNELETAYRRGVRENPAIADLGYSTLRRVVFRPGVPTGSYAKGSDELVIGCGNYGAVEHEPGHFWADTMDLPCWREVWHTETLGCQAM